MPRKKKAEVTLDTTPVAVPLEPPVAPVAVAAPQAAIPPVEEPAPAPAPAPKDELETEEETGTEEEGTEEEGEGEEGEEEEGGEEDTGGGSAPRGPGVGASVLRGIGGVVAPDGKEEEEAGSGEDSGPFPEAEMTSEDEEEIMGVSDEDIQGEGADEEGNYKDLLEISPEDAEEMFGTGERRRTQPKKVRRPRAAGSPSLGGVIE